jgi:hypothetical protein
MLLDIVRVNKHARALLQTPVSESDPTLGEFLDQRGLGGYVIDNYMVPLGSAIWSANPTTFTNFPARALFQFLDNHGLLAVRGRPTWRSVVGGSSTYVERLIPHLTSPPRLSTPIVKIERNDTGVEVIEIDINNKKISKEYSKTVKVSLAEAGMTVSGSSVSKVSVTTLRVRVRDAVNNWTEWNDLALPGGTVVASQNQTAKKTLKMNTKKAVTGKAIAQFVSLKLPKNSKISVKISASSKKVCKVVKTSVRGIKPGICRITVSVKPRTGKAKIKTVSLRVSK